MRIEFPGPLFSVAPKEQANQQAAFRYT